MPGRGEWTIAEGLDELLKEMLKAARIDSGHRRQPRRGDVDHWELAERLVKSQRELAEGREFTLDGVGPGLVIGSCDGSNVERIVANLLSNAVKHSPSGGHITIAVERDGQEARLAVRDRGCGIPALALPHIFEPFYRVGDVADRFGSRHIPGFGIGLFAARELAHRHDGRIEVTNTEGLGKHIHASTAGAQPAACSVRGDNASAIKQPDDGVENVAG